MTTMTATHNGNKKQIIVWRLLKAAEQQLHEMYNLQSNVNVLMVKLCFS